MIFFYLFIFVQIHLCPLNICLKLRRQFIIEEPDSYTAFKKKRETKQNKTTYSYL